MSPIGGSLAAARIPVSTTATSPPTRPRSAVLLAAASACCRRRAVCTSPIATSSWSSIRSTARRTRLHGIPWYAVSLCAVDADGPRAALVDQHRDGRALRGDARWRARRGTASRSHRRQRLASAPSIVGLSGYPPRRLGWKQYRALGASALDLCSVACGRLDAYVDCSRNAHGPWDYLGGMLVCLEAGAVIIDAFDRDLVVLEHAARRTPVAAASQVLLGESIAARRSFD